MLSAILSDTSRCMRTCAPAGDDTDVPMRAATSTSQNKRRILFLPVPPLSRDPSAVLADGGVFCGTGQGVPAQRASRYSYLHHPTDRPVTHIAEALRR